MSRRLVRPLAIPAATLLTALGACGGGAPASRPPEEKAEFVQRRNSAPAAAPAPSAATFPRSRRVADEADFSGKGVAGGMAGAPVLSQATADAAAAAPSSAPPPPAPAPPTVQPSSAAAEAAAAPMLIRTGSASVEVDSLETAVAGVRALAARVGGYVANTSLAAGREQVRAATLELRVPAARFDELVGGLAPFGRVERVDVQAQDVGEEFVDVTARAANARRLEARLVDLLARRTGKLEEVLAVERELARVREEIERYDGRLRYLRTRAATSTLAVTVHEPAPLLAATPDANPLADAVRAAGRNFVALLSAVIAASGVWIPVGALAYAAWRWQWRRRAAAVTRRRATAPPPAPNAA